MNQFCCSTCNNPLKIKNGDYIFAYNTECCNNHISKNVEIEDILSTLKQKSFICESHKKKNIIHCFNCDVDICFLCYKESHKLHKIEYLKSLNYDQICRNSFENDLKEDKKYIESFIVELMHFKSQLNLFIDVLKSNLLKFLKFRCDLVNNTFLDNSPYINIENAKNFDKNFIEMKNLIRKFLYSDVFVKRYDNLKSIFDLMFKKGKYIENQNIKDILKCDIIPIDENYFMEKYKNKFYILEKTCEVNLKKYKFNNVFERLMNFEINKIKLKTNENIKKRLSFYILSYLGHSYQVRKTLLYEATIENLCDFTIKEIATLYDYINLFVLSEDKNLIDYEGKVSLYDKSFKSQKLVSYFGNGIEEFLKIDSITFICSAKDNFNKYIYFVKINDNNIYRIQIFNCGDKLIYFSEKKNIIFTYDTKFIYLSYFNSSKIDLELIQKIELKNIYYDLSSYPYNYFLNTTKLIKSLTSFNDESIYIGVKINKIQFLVQYKLIESELVEVSRLELD